MGLQDMRPRKNKGKRNLKKGKRRIGEILFIVAFISLYYFFCNLLTDKIRSKKERKRRGKEVKKKRKKKREEEKRREGKLHFFYFYFISLNCAFSY